MFAKFRFLKCNYFYFSKEIIQKFSINNETLNFPENDVTFNYNR